VLPSVLLVDLGNSRLKWGLWKGAELGQTGAALYRGRSLESALECAWTPLAPPATVCLASVAGPAAQVVEQWVSSRWGVPVKRVEAGRELNGVRNGYHNPAQLGVDRWAALVAARSRMGGPLCVVDCGTAVTVDLLPADGNHLGGWIIPGIALMRESLLGAASDLRGVGVGVPLRGPARDTAGAIAAGGIHAVAGLVQMARFSLSGEGAPAVLLTGGDAESLFPLLPDAEYEPHLVLYGIAHLAGL